MPDTVPALSLAAGRVGQGKTEKKKEEFWETLEMRLLPKSVWRTKVGFSEEVVPVS